MEIASIAIDLGLHAVESVLSAINMPKMAVTMPTNRAIPTDLAADARVFLDIAAAAASARNGRPKIIDARHVLRKIVDIASPSDVEKISLAREVSGSADQNAALNRPRTMAYRDSSCGLFEPPVGRKHIDPSENRLWSTDPRLKSVSDIKNTSRTKVAC